MDVCFGSATDIESVSSRCPLYPQKRTWVSTIVMSANKTLRVRNAACGPSAFSLMLVSAARRAAEEDWAIVANRSSVVQTIIAKMPPRRFPLPCLSLCRP
jgi:hypothetical protein